MNPMHIQEMLRIDPLCLELSWRAGLLQRLRLRWSEPDEDSGPVSPWSLSLLGWLRRYLAGKPSSCPRLPLDWCCVSGFSRHVLTVLHDHVLAGQWISYGELAARSGRPGAARAVGRAMAGNPWPLLMPCHRVLGRDGQLTGFGEGLDIKRFLLTTEGITFGPSGLAVRPTLSDAHDHTESCEHHKPIRC